MKWEYKTVKMVVSSFWSGVDLDTEKADEFINQFGKEGWELVSAFDLNEGYGSSKEVVLIFKRPSAD
ncbi:MAG: DUF4177 domain-containing protein [Blastocatellia bacterium]|nr:DUF4177 domain-containing protein [Blastocatellia bacterium]